MMSNFDLCQQMFSFLKAIDVEAVIVCAGARNAALVQNLETEKFNKVFYFEERSAAFYAIGLMKQSGKPIAIITTSGTAAAELLPATIESFYQGLPLILITADRPKSYRGRGAPQSIERVGLFSHYVEQSLDWDIHEKKLTVSTQLEKPIHFNLCFDEPLLDQKSNTEIETKWSVKPKFSYPKATQSDFLKMQKPLIVIGQIQPDQKKEVCEFIKKIKAPVYLEALSLLKNEESISKWVLKSTDNIVKNLFKDQVCETVIRIGGVPTLRFWRDLENEFKNIPVYNFADLPFSGLAKASQNFSIDFSMAPENNLVSEKLMKHYESDISLQHVKADLLKKFSKSEPSFVHQLSNQIQDQPIYLGNSLPIREWDLFSASFAGSSQAVYANRGANGIDGQIATYLGWSQGLKSSWCLVGDLTALYDLAALGLCSSASSPEKKRIVIMNNRGGQIFKRIFKNDHFINSHQIEFQNWAQLWKWDYICIKSASDFEQLKNLKSHRAVIEMQPDADQTQSFWDAWDQSCNKI